MKEKKKLTEEQQAILIYSGELLIFAIVFLVLGILRFLNIIPYNAQRILVFNWITLFGGAWGIIDFFWAVFSKKKRAKSCMIDKALVLVLAIFMIVYDLISLIAKPQNELFYSYFLASGLIYAGIIFIFQGIYHYFKPLPSLIEEIRKAEEEERLEKEKEIQQAEEETKEHD